MIAISNQIKCQYNFNVLFRIEGHFNFVFLLVEYNKGLGFNKVMLLCAGVRELWPLSHTKEENSSRFYVLLA